MAEGSSHGQPGPYFYQMGGKTYASLPTEMLQGDQTMPPLRADVERHSRRRGSDTGEHFGTGPQSSHINAATIFTERQRGEDASHAQPQSAERNGRESRTS